MRPTAPNRSGALLCRYYTNVRAGRMYGKGGTLGIVTARVSPNTRHRASRVTVGGQVGRSDALSRVLGLSMAHICPRGSRSCLRWRWPSVVSMSPWTVAAVLGMGAVCAGRCVVSVGRVASGWLTWFTRWTATGPTFRYSWPWPILGNGLRTGGCTRGICTVGWDGCRGSILGPRLSGGWSIRNGVLRTIISWCSGCRICLSRGCLGPGSRWWPVGMIGIWRPVHRLQGCIRGGELRITVLSTWGRCASSGRSRQGECGAFVGGCLLSWCRWPWPGSSGTRRGGCCVGGWNGRSVSGRGGAHRGGRVSLRISRKVRRRGCWAGRLVGRVSP